MNPQRFLELHSEFDSFIRSLHGLYFDSLTGYQLISKHLTEEQESVARLLRGHPEAEVSFQDTCHLSHSHIAKNPALSWLYLPTQADLKRRNGTVTGHFKLTHLGSNQIDPSLRKVF